MDQKWRDSMRFSIIVPIHNAEKYLAECLKSIDNQEFQNFEVILVVNASTDNSLQMCQNWKKDRSSIKILTTEIPGVSHARNMGIESAEGEWLVFLDSDDWMRKHALFVLDQGTLWGRDFVVTNYSSRTEKRTYGQKSSLISQLDYQKALFDRAGHFKEVADSLTWNPIVLDSVWGKAYNADLVKKKNIRFDQDVSIGEDFLFNYFYSRQVQNVCCIDEDIYYYRESQQSVSRKSDLMAVEKRMTFLEKLEGLRVSPELNSARNFKFVDILLRSVFAGTRNLTDMSNTYHRLLPVFKEEAVAEAIQKCRSRNLSNSRQRDYFYCRMVKKMKQGQYRQVMWIGLFYNYMLMVKENMKKIRVEKP